MSRHVPLLRTHSACLALLVSFALLSTSAHAGAQPARAPAKPVSPAAEIDALVSRAMTTFDVPGLSLAIVKDGKVVLAKGYGVRKLGATAPADAQTLFGIASNTKVFTAVALALLVEEGKLEWDAPVVRYLPWFQMWDPWVTRELTIRDLLVHRSGLPLGAGDLLWWPPSTYNRREIAERLRYVPPTTSFRSAYAYDNVLYLVAGEVIETLSGRSWEDFVGERILKRVGMNGSNLRHSDAAAAGNVAATHAPVEGTVRVIKPFLSDNTNPAGGINSNAEDMAKWLLVLLNEGRLADGTRLYGDRTARELTTIVTPQPIAEPPAGLEPLRASFRGYGLGLGLSDYRGRKLVSHTGGLPGYVSRVSWIPDAELGVAVLTNQESGEAFSAITNAVLDQFLGAERFDWVDAYAKVRARNAERLAEANRTSAAERDAASTPSLPLERYAGTYTDAWYGDVAITHENGALRIRFTKTPSLVGALEHWQHDTFVAKWDDRELRADAFVTFALRPDGTIEQAKMRAVSPDTDFSFDFHHLLLEPVPKKK